MPCTLLVLSDTHGDVKRLSKVLRSRAARADAIIHLGDGLDDLEALRMGGVGVIPWEGVRGNSDHSAGAPLHRVFEACGNRIFLTHGHLMGANEGVGRMLDAAASAGADAVFYGHTHRARWEEYSGVLALCPGSLSRPRDGASGSFAIVKVLGRRDFDVRILRLDERGGSLS